MNSDMSSDEHQIIYEQYFVDVEDPSTSSVIDEDVDLDVTGETPLESDDKLVDYFIRYCVDLVFSVSVRA
uniref:Uncharacterized protein n=1 Tax=Parascaris equorum TaxID=6256 RepID=A0A914R1D5_PAREQ